MNTHAAVAHQVGGLFVLSAATLCALKLRTPAAA
jgi:hypothetical protein